MSSSNLYVPFAGHQTRVVVPINMTKFQDLFNASSVSILCLCNWIRTETKDEWGAENVKKWCSFENKVVKMLDSKI